MFKCENCKRKRITVKCLTCSHMYCSGCIQIEEHHCEKIEDKIKKEIDTIIKKNQKLTAPKTSDK